MTRYLFFFSFFLILSSCNSNENKKYKRIISEYKLEKINHFEHTFGKAFRLFVQNDIISLSNSPKFQIFQYNLDGELIRTLTKPGNAPWESHALWYFSFSNNGNRYWVHDYNKQMLKCFDYKKDSMILYKKEITQGNVHLIDDNRFIIPRTDYINNKFLFSVFDIKNEKYIKDISLNDSLGIKSTVVNKKDLSMYLLGGNFSSNDTGNEILYYMYSVGRFIIINKSNMSFKIFQDIHNQPLPTAYLKNKRVHLSNNYSNLSLSGAINSQNVYLLSPKNESNKLSIDNKYFLDIYRVKSGEYLKSIEIPLIDNIAIPIHIAVTENKLVVLYDNEEVYIYKLDNLMFAKL